jgi:hypothetical protein
MYTASVACSDLDFSNPKDAALHLLSVVGFARPMTVGVTNQHTGEEFSITLGEADLLKESPPATFSECAAWAKTLSDDQIAAVLTEMRDRGAAVAYYDAAELATMFDDGRSWEDFMSEERGGMEEAMCDAARNYAEENCPPADFDDGDDNGSDDDD